MPAFGTPTDLPELLAAIKARVVSGTGLDASLVFLTLSPERDVAKFPPDDTFVTLRMARVVGIAGYTAGGGMAAYTGQLRVSLWHRRFTDELLHDHDFLTACDALYPAWLKLLGALHLFAPVRKTDATKALVIDPIRNTPGHVMPDRPPDGWGRLDDTWEVKFVHRTG